MYEEIERTVRPLRHLRAGIVALALGAGGMSIAAEERGAPPPGVSRDQSRPAEGALKGGSVQPDRSSGPTPEAYADKCRQLAGELREQCLRDLSAGGGAKPPQTEPPFPAQPGPSTAPPPPQSPHVP